MCSRGWRDGQSEMENAASLWPFSCCGCAALFSSKGFFSQLPTPILFSSTNRALIILDHYYIQQWYCIYFHILGSWGTSINDSDDCSHKYSIVLLIFWRALPTALARLLVPLASLRPLPPSLVNTHSSSLSLSLLSALFSRNNLLP